MIIIKSDEEIVIMRKCGKILAAILGKLRAEIRPGIKTGQLDIIVADNREKGELNPLLRTIAASLRICVFR